MQGRPRTKAQAYRIQLITQELGCLACDIEGESGGFADAHHCDDQRQDHDRIYGLCPWHHRGLSVDGSHRNRMRNMYGPSKAHEPRAFTERYGTEQQLLDLQNQRIEEWEKSRVSKVI